MTDTCVNEHHWLLHYSGIRTAELHLGGLGAVGGAATPVSAFAAELGFVAVHTDAVFIFKMDGFLGFLHSYASFPFLKKNERIRTLVKYSLH